MYVYIYIYGKPCVLQYTVWYCLMENPVLSCGAEFQELRQTMINTSNFFTHRNNTCLHWALSTTEKNPGDITLATVVFKVQHHISVT